MDESALRIFLSLAETENMRDTAALLGANQSNVSRALARLERAVGVELFDRMGRRLVLNSRGTAFRTDAAAVLDSLETARRHAEALVEDAATIRIGFLHSVAGWLVPDTVRRFRAGSPHARVSLRQGFGADLYSWLDAGVIDVALCTAPLASRRSVRWQAITREQLCIAVPDAHAIAGRKSASASSIDGEAFIAFSRITEMRGVVDKILGDAEASVPVAFESSEIETMRALVAGGLGVSILPRTPGRTTTGVSYVPLAPALYRELGVAWKPAGSPSALAEEFARAAIGEGLSAAG